MFENTSSVLNIKRIEFKRNKVSDWLYHSAFVTRGVNRCSQITKLSILHADITNMQLTDCETWPSWMNDAFQIVYIKIYR